jgi:hypothetical protein
LWFVFIRYVRCDELAESAKEAVRLGELKIIPEHHTKMWFHWMDNIRYVGQWKAKQCLLALKQTAVYSDANSCLVCRGPYDVYQILRVNCFTKNLLKCSM